MKDGKRLTGVSVLRLGLPTYATLTGNVGFGIGVGTDDVPT